MAILGETFKDYVKNQINKRQEKLSSFNKDNDLLLYLTSNTTFIRLTSGVDVGPNVLTEYGLPLNLAGNLLAKQYILEAARFNGNFTSGVGYNLSDSSYGFASSTDYGFVPPPGITQMDVKTLNRGTIREANIQLICHNITQLHIINILFLKLKYTLLLEWGHTVYYDNEGKLKQGFDIPNFSNDFLAGGKTSSTILVELEKRRKESCGNYDAFFGWIKNFQWEVQENGTYVVTISAISTGDVIESLKINTNFDPNKKEDKDDNRYSKSDLHHILGTIRQNGKLNKDGFLNGYNTGDPENCLNSEALECLSSRKSNYNEPGDDNSALTSNKVLSEKEAIRVKFPNLQVTTNKNGKDIQSDQYYIKLGALLRIIESFILYYDISKNEIYSSTKLEELSNAQTLNQPPPSPDAPTHGSPPIFKINHDYDANECLTTLNQVPIDPRIALIPLSTDPKTGPMSNISTKYRIKDDANPYVAKTMHIYVNIDYIISSLDNNVDEDGDIALQSFIMSLLDGISSALGGINKFEIDYDDATNTFSIVDTALVPVKYQATNEISQISVNYFNPKQTPGTGSFVTSFGLKTDIYSSIGNAIALGAQGGGSSLSAASTSYSNINSGITDRIVTVKANANNPTDEDTEKKIAEEQANVEKEFSNFITLLNSTTQKKSLSPDDIDYYSNYIMNVLQKDLYNATQDGTIPGTIFIPLNLNLTVKGISGLKQYQVFTITENLLPKEYYNRLKFITTTIEHKVDASKGWETVINTIGIPYKKPLQNPKPPISLLPKSE
jgi:hypothetical protein